MLSRETVNGALAGSVAALAWAATQPLDKRAFRCGYDDLEILGKLVTRGPRWQGFGLILHVLNGASFGAVYALARPLSPLPPLASAVTAGMAEHVGLWPLTRLVDSHHPARSELTPLAGNRRAFAQATWRHLLFGLVLGEVERRLNPGPQAEPLPPAASNGHGQLEDAVEVVA